MSDLDRRDARNGHVGRHVVQDDRSRADFRAFSDVDVSEKLRVCSEHNAVADFGMPVAGFVSGSAERYAVENRNVVPDFRRFADDESRRMVEQNPVADFRRRVDIDRELLADEALEHFGEEEPTVFPQDVRHAVGLDGLEAFEKEERFENGTASGIAFERRPKIFCGILDDCRIFAVCGKEKRFELGAAEQRAFEFSGKHGRLDFGEGMSKDDLLVQNGFEKRFLAGKG